MEHLTVFDKPRPVRLERVEEETPIVKTLYFKDRWAARARPGQFIMVWAHGLDEMPMSLSSFDGRNLASITVRPWGKGSEALCKMSKGDLVAVRGPYGNSFSLSKGPALLVGGGTGLAPLMPLMQQLVSFGARCHLVLAGRSKSDLLFLKRAKRILSKERGKLTPVTDDASYGIGGLASDAAERALEEERVKIIYACGPELMIKKLFLLAEKKRLQMEASLERSMKCAIGLCGICCIGRYLVCSDGPIFNIKKLREVEGELAVSRRDSAGRLVPIQPAR